jgi:hypothetical protein
VGAIAITNRLLVLEIFGYACTVLTIIDGSCTHFPLEFFDKFCIFGMFLHGINKKKKKMKESEDLFSTLTTYLTTGKILKWPTVFCLLTYRKSETSFPNIFFLKILNLHGPFKISKFLQIVVTLIGTP